jgi:hypothetical protein
LSLKEDEFVGVVNRFAVGTPAHWVWQNTKMESRNRRAGSICDHAQLNEFLGTCKQFREEHFQRFQDWPVRHLVKRENLCAKTLTHLRERPVSKQKSQKCHWLVWQCDHTTEGLAQFVTRTTEWLSKQFYGSTSQSSEHTELNDFLGRWKHFLQERSRRTEWLLGGWTHLPEERSRRTIRLSRQMDAHPRGAITQNHSTFSADGRTS